MAETDPGEPSRTPFRILTVCTGNICRSPAAERLLQAELNRANPHSFVVSSAGTRALIGHPIQEQMARLLNAADVPTSHFTSRQMTVGHIREADLVLALTRQHRSIVVEQEPLALAKSYTLSELARISETLTRPGDLSPAASWKFLVSKARRARGRSLGEDRFDDVIDPYGQTNEVYSSAFDKIHLAVQALTRW